MGSSWRPALRRTRNDKNTMPMLQIHNNKVSFSMLRRSMFVPKLNLHTIVRHHKCISRKLYEVQDSGRSLCSQDLALIPYVRPPTLRVRSINDFLNFYLNSGAKRTEFHLKIDNFPGLKPYINSLHRVEV